MNIELYIIIPQTEEERAAHRAKFPAPPPKTQSAASKLGQIVQVSQGGQIQIVGQGQIQLAQGHGSPGIKVVKIKVRDF